MYELQLIRKCKGCEQIIQVFFVLWNRAKELIEYSFFFNILNSIPSTEHKSYVLLTYRDKFWLQFFLNLQAYPVVLKMLHRFFFLCVITNVGNRNNCCSEGSHKRAYASQGHARPQRFKGGFARNPEILKVLSRFFKYILF